MPIVSLVDIEHVARGAAPRRPTGQRVEFLTFGVPRAPLGGLVCAFAVLSISWTAPARGAEVATNSNSDLLADLLRHRCFVEQSLQAIVCNKSASCEFASKDQILVTACRVFGDCEIMWIQT